MKFDSLADHSHLAALAHDNKTDKSRRMTGDKGGTASLPVIVPKVRHELKFIIPESLSECLRAYVTLFCEPDPNAKGSPPTYTVSTLQLDSPSLSLHLAKERKQVNRFKLRVRTYGEGKGERYFFEIKRKEGIHIRKTRSTVSASEYGPDLFDASRMAKCFDSTKESLNHWEFLRLSRQLGARPAVWIRYERESWIGREDRSVRVTIDRRLRYRKADGYRDFGDEQAGWRSMDSGMVFRREFPAAILEIKSSLQVPKWILKMINFFNLERTGFCKYSAAMRLEDLFAGGSFNTASERCAF